MIGAYLTANQSMAVVASVETGPTANQHHRKLASEATLDKDYLDIKVCIDRSRNMHRHHCTYSLCLCYTQHMCPVTFC